jgi:translation initiation factor 1 (eIF-1/SUI1)
VRAERKGHGGKTVTRVGGLAGDDDALEALAGRMRRALGCGVRVEDGELLAQGDLVPRVEAWLKENLHQ